MPEAVIVAAARSPIGRAFKGSLRAVRGDDLGAAIVRAALDQVPELDPTEIDELIVGCGQPAGEQGYGLARVIAVLLGFDHLPGATVQRYCASSLQSTRMALHAIKAGEGDVFVSAGVEVVSHYGQGKADGMPDTRNPVFARGVGARGRPSGTWTDPREAGLLPDVYLAMGETAENVASCRGVSRQDQDEFAALSQNRAEASIAAGFFKREITPVDRRRFGGGHRRLPASRGDDRWPGRAQAGVSCRWHRHRRQLLPAERRRSGRGDHVRHSVPATSGMTPLARIVSTGVSALSPEIMGSDPDRGVPSGAGRGRHDDRRRRSDGNQRGLRRAGSAQLRRVGHRPGPGERARRRHRLGSPVRDDRRPDHHHPVERVALGRQADRPGDDVRRRWPGHGHGARAPQLTPVEAVPAPA